MSNRRILAFCLSLLVVLLTVQTYYTPQVYADYFEVRRVEAPATVVVGQRFNVRVTTAYGFSVTTIVSVQLFDVRANDWIGGTEIRDTLFGIGTKTYEIALIAGQTVATYDLAAITNWWDGFRWNFGGRVEFRIQVTLKLFKITINADPKAATVTVDGQAYTGSQLPQSFDWEDGSSHTVTVASEVSGGPGVRYLFTQWNDGNVDLMRTIKVSGSLDLTARFKTQYFLKVVSDYGSTSGEGWYDSGTQAFASVNPREVSANIPYKYVLTGWSGDAGGAGDRSNPITMDGPKTARAVWERKLGTVGGPTCFIATATYGSELSPEVQVLRNFRDQKAIWTFAGDEFMKVFNALYYSFSPDVAWTISQNEGLKVSMRYVLYPLVGILSVSNRIYDLLEFNPETAVVAAGLFASTLIGLTYALPFTYGTCAALSRVFKRKASVRHLIMAMGFLSAALVLILVSELTSLAPLMQVSASMAVIIGVCLPGISLKALRERIIASG